MKQKLIAFMKKIKAVFSTLTGNGIVKWKKLYSADRKKAYALAGIILAVFVLCIAGLITLAVISGKDEVTYREAQVEKGNLTVGVTESGNVAIGTSEQTFDLDISEYTGSSSTFSWNGSMGGGMGQMLQNSGAASSSSTGRSLEIEAVYVSAGQEIEKGTPILKLTDESVNSIRQELKEDASDAQITYEQTMTNKQKVSIQAQGDLDINTAYGTYAESEYSNTVVTLNESVESIQEQLTEAQEDLTEDTDNLAKMQTLLAEQKTVLANAEYARDNTSRDDNLYWWIVAVNTVSDTEDLIETLEDEIDSTEEEIEDLNKSIASLSTQLSLAQKELEAGSIAAKVNKDLRQYQYENAQEIYDVTVGQSNFEEEKAKTDYDTAQEKLNEFDSVIQEGVISSEYTGVITQVGINVGDSLEQDGSIITLNDYEEATITVTVDEEDMEYAQTGNAVNVVFTAFPDDVFRGEVTEIGDAQINSNTNTTTYSVTVTITGDIEGLYEGMSTEVTFITKESAEVLYIPNRAVIREGTESYVKMKDEKGNMVTREVTTGFSDGVHVEIKEGLSEGDTILIER
ncbi:efflux RND transporter periplasmic adaptor subunit [Kineothrix sedimenti]|uniref:Efflux RND transporter periplasmic adaptor subunit n=1 Tax=Kineothrix sedimenti TaxID=3123317 RepID=A0ABZ3EYG5_9FIRM